MTLFAKLNRRHKATLFVILLASGGSLIAGAGMQVTIGIMLLGVALAWAFGSNSRVVHWLFVGTGLLLMAAPLVDSWYGDQKQLKRYQRSVADFERKLPDFATKYYYRFEIVANDKQHFGTRLGAPLDSATELEGVLNRYGYKRDERQKILENVKEFASGKLIDDRSVKVRFYIPGSEGRTPEIEKLSQGARYETLENRQYEHTAVNSTTGSRVGWNAKERVPVGPITVYKGDRRIQVSPDAFPEALAKGWSPRRKQFVDISLLIGSDFWRSPPQWYSDAIAAGVDLAAVPEYEKPGDPPRPFSLRRSLVEHWLFEAPGALLFVIGVGLIFGLTVRKATWARS